MTANTVPVFGLTPNMGQARTNIANTNRDGTGTLSLVFTAGANGSIVTQIGAYAIGTTTAGIVRFYLHDGSNYRLYMEEKIQAYVPSSTVRTSRFRRKPPPPPSPSIPVQTDLWLPAGWKIYAAPHNAEYFDFIIEGVNL